MNKELIRQNMLSNEKTLSNLACFNKDAIRLVDKKDDDIRPEFYRDIDKVIYSLAYTRYIDKTQVFSNKKNDHITKRIIHVQFVSKIARTIGRALNLNEDLIEAIALAHDIGHVPFGHLGERFLNEISLAHGEGYFMHNVESVRDLMVLEKNGKGLNLTIQTLDGALCHNGEFLQDKYKPIHKTKEDFLHDYEMCYKEADYASKLIPMTMEGCVVRISDIIGYLGRDIEDAVRLGILKIDDVPDSIKEILGNGNGQIVDTIVNDIIENSFGKDYISMSPKIYQAIADLKDYNYKFIYSLANTEEDKAHIKEMFEVLFDSLLDDIKTNNEQSHIYTNYIDDMNDEYKENTTPERMVIDYIAGMTDDYFQSEYKQAIK